MAKLPHNLQSIHDKVTGCYPGIVIGEIGDQAHQVENSDHNPDSRGIVHAIDLMFENDTNFHKGAPTTLKWLLTPGVRNSLEYLIHDETIYSVNNQPTWSGEQYRGSDPHTNHIHVSGKHGSTGKNAATGTGYDAAAEKLTPAGSPCSTATHPDSPLAPPEDDVTPQDKQDIINGVVHTLLGAPINASGTTVSFALQQGMNTVLLTTTLGSSGPNVGQALQGTYQAVQQLAEAPVPPATE